MTSVRGWASQLLLRAPAPLRSLRNAPCGIGALIHRWSHRVVPADEKVWAQVESGPAEGLWLRLNPRTGQHYLRGYAEAATQNILVSHLRPGMVFYDLGANIGLFSMLGARLVGLRGKVFSFEPDLEVAQRLRENADRNGFTNITVVASGVWSSTGMLEFHAAEASSPDHGTGKFAVGGGGRLTHCISLDDFVETQAPPDAIKCDVEGAEVEVLRGARRTLAVHKPWVLCETHSSETQSDSHAILRELGYTIQMIDPFHLFAHSAGKDDVDLAELWPCDK